MCSPHNVAVGGGVFGGCFYLECIKLSSTVAYVGLNAFLEEKDAETIDERNACRGKVQGPVIYKKGVL